MATKDANFFVKNKFQRINSSQQFTNLNLNQNHRSDDFETPIQSSLIKTNFNKNSGKTKKKTMLQFYIKKNIKEKASKNAFSYFVNFCVQHLFLIDSAFYFLKKIDFRKCYEKVFCKTAASIIIKTDQSSVVSNTKKEGCSKIYKNDSNLKNQNFIHKNEENKKSWINQISSPSKTSNNNSTLSLHISAYENSMIEISESNKNIEKGSIKKSPKLQDPFEYPRQMEVDSNNDGANRTPEIMQFKASQKLLSQNQDSSKLPYQLVPGPSSMTLEDLFSSYTLKDRQETSSTYSTFSRASSTDTLNTAQLGIIQRMFDKALLPPYAYPPILKARYRNYADKHYTLTLEHLSSRYVRALELTDRKHRRVFDILWHMFPDNLICGKCYSEYERKEHKKLFWDFRDATICCSQCLNIDDLRHGFITSLFSLLNPTFYQCVEKNLQRNPRTYDNFLPRFSFNYHVDALSAINGIRRYTADYYSERHLALKQDLWDAHATRFQGNNAAFEMISNARGLILFDTACFKVVDACFAYAIKCFPTYIPKVCCGCGSKGKRGGHH